MLPKWEENTVGKGEIAHYKQFPRFPTVFSKLRLVLQTRKNQGLFGKGLKIKESMDPCPPVRTVQADMGWSMAQTFGWLYWARVISWLSVTHMCFLAFLHQY